MLIKKHSKVVCASTSMAVIIQVLAMMWRHVLLVGYNMKEPQENRDVSILWDATQSS